MRASLIHFWRLHLTVLLGAAVATAVLAGALLVGDSVRGSLRALTLERLGRIEQALVAGRFLAADLGTRLAQNPHYPASLAAPVPLILLSGSATAAQGGNRASRVQIQGIEPDFDALFTDGPGAFPADLLAADPQPRFAAVVVNAALAAELGVELGDDILLHFRRPSDIHPESLFGRRQTDEVVQRLRLTLVGVVPDRGAGRFGLQAHQGQPFNAYVQLAALQKALTQPDRANAFLFAADHRTQAPLSTVAALEQALRGTVELADLGLRLRRGDDYFALESTRFVLQEDEVERAQSLARDQGLVAQPVLTYLANSLEVGERSVPYSTVSALDPGLLGGLQLVNGAPATGLEPGEILLDEWTAAQLAAEVGDAVDLAYYEVAPGEELLSRRASFRLRGVVALAGLAVDRDLTPTFPGIQNARNMADWQPPFPINLQRLRAQDEDYWDLYGAAPKGFIGVADGQRLWRSRFGVATAVRLAAPGRELEAGRQFFAMNLLESTTPAQAGLSFSPVKAQGLAAAAGATDFGQLFIAFSLFLIAAAALLVALLFRLGVDRRAPEMGLLLAVGFPLKAVRRRFMAEGLLVAGLGGLLGLAGAVGYAALMMAGLRSWWQEAVGTRLLYLYVEPLSLAAGYTASLAVVGAVIALSVRQFGRVPARALLAGVTTTSQPCRRGRRRLLAWIMVVVGTLLVVGGLGAQGAVAVALFFAAGAVWLAVGLILFALWLGGRRGLGGVGGRWRLGLNNCARQPGRSLLGTGLVACAAFVIVAVGAQRRVGSTGEGKGGLPPGTGGFELIAETDIALHGNLNTSQGRFDLGLPEAEDLWNKTAVFPLRSEAGEDVSCLNLYRPQKPRILGVAKELIDRGGFVFSDYLEHPDLGDNPWRWLDQDLGGEVIPALADYNSAQWILHRGLGDEIEVEDEAGRPVRLRLVGLLAGSIFQGELLIAEHHFTRLFPQRGGYGYFLFDTPPAKAAAVRTALERGLAPYGLDAVSAAGRLARYQAVENTYLSTFQTLGGLGLLLGTVGLGVVLLRNAVERRGEWAFMRALGFRRRLLGRLLLVEQAVLLSIGLGIGTAAALLAAAPHWTRQPDQVPWGSLGLILALVFGTGLAASALAGGWAMRATVLEGLKGE